MTNCIIHFGDNDDNDLQTMCGISSETGHPGRTNARNQWENSYAQDTHMIFIMKGPVFSLFAISCKSIMRHLYLLAIARSRIKNNEITLWHVRSWIRMLVSVRVSMCPFHSLSGAGSNLFNLFTFLDHMNKVCILWVYVSSPIQIPLHKHITLRAHTPVNGISSYASLHGDVHYYQSLLMSTDQQEDCALRPYGGESYSSEEAIAGTAITWTRQHTWIIWSGVTSIVVKRSQPRRRRPVSEDEGVQNEADEKADEFDIEPGISFWIVVDVPKQKKKHLENEFLYDLHLKSTYSWHGRWCGNTFHCCPLVIGSENFHQ